ncbi:hypothetical protein N7462_001794 [Penicillium macrosclerotiorum]|uniref:uncharacterized protein n=1 Tax=Penicillium macrosclerotiorum TaxID=303699 RepID=UPI0025498F32|nr:uncharacterized protein N7462_001794 [Penicillium macrosclerotiorum]KAJ5692371.1 hypothetical protein N7462_001794 [Penicillium macrosclerotiorum]
MPSQPPLPPLLTPYVSALPESSLTVVSSILGATSNWLVLRFLHASLSTSPSPSASLGFDDLPNGHKRKVVLVSFLRGWEFWKVEAKRLGLDLARLSDKHQFAFIDGLSELFSAPQTAAPIPSRSPISMGNPVRTTVPVRSSPGALPGRTPPVSAAPTVNSGNTTGGQKEPGIAKKLHFSGQGTAALAALEKDIISVINQQKASMESGDELLLVVDQPDFLLAATGSNMGIGATEMADWITMLQQQVHATVLTLAADSPLIHMSTSGNQLSTPTETEHAGFAIGMAHRAQSVMQLRTLETGAARDVSGVLRISRGGGWTAEPKEALDEKELLYYIQRDGGVRVFGRGET